MLSERIKHLLKANWGEPSDALECFAYAKVIGMEVTDKYACFIFAMNPEDEDEIITITRDYQDYEIMHWSVKDLFALYNKDGVFVHLDDEFNPRTVRTILENPWKY